MLKSSVPTCTHTLYLCLVCKRDVSTDRSRAQLKLLVWGTVRMCCGLSCVPLINVEVIICSTCGGYLVWKENLGR